MSSAARRLDLWVGNMGNGASANKQKAQAAASTTGLATKANKGADLRVSQSQPVIAGGSSASSSAAAVHVGGGTDKPLDNSSSSSAQANPSEVRSAQPHTQQTVPIAAAPSGLSLHSMSASGQALQGVPPSASSHSLAGQPPQMQPQPQQQQQHAQPSGQGEGLAQSQSTQQQQAPIQSQQQAAASSAAAASQALPSQPGSTSAGDSGQDGAVLPEESIIAIKRPQALIKTLSVDLLKTYNLINARYYARKRAKKKSAQKPNNGYDDPNFDYVVKAAERLNERYVVDCVIGKGSFGRVVKAYDELRDEFVAVKIVKSKRAFRKQALIEIKILQSLHEADPEDQSNIVRMKDTFLHHNHQCIVFELLSMNLYELLRDTKFYGVSLNLIRKFAKSLLKTLEFIGKHKTGIIHCDLKPENVLLRNSKHSAIKVIDFGSACFQDEKMYTYIQSRFYRAPEVLLGCQYDCAIDMWSLGCILVEMHTGKPIFDGANAHEQVFLQAMILGMPPVRMIQRGSKAKDYFAYVQQTDSWRLRRGGLDFARLQGRRKTIGQIIGVDTYGPRGCRKDEKTGHTLRDYKNFEDLVTKMLEYDPALRIKPTDALNHPFFQISAEMATSTEEAQAQQVAATDHYLQGSSSQLRVDDVKMDDVGSSNRSLNPPSSPPHSGDGALHQQHAVSAPADVTMSTAQTTPQQHSSTASTASPV